MRLRFQKMHGLGNDVLIIDGLHQTVSMTPEHVQQLSDRRRGVGFDQLMLIEQATQHGCDFAYRIFNADGTVAEQCGNGARCVARYLIDHRHAAKRLSLQSPRGPIVAELPDPQTSAMVRVDMGPPVFAPSQVPFEASEEADSYALSLGQVGVEIGVLSMGNPHAVLRVEDVNRAPVDHLGPAIGQHPRFPRQTNVGFLETVDRQRAKLRVFERVAGETEACGSGACAAVVAGRRWNIFDEQVTVRLPGGDLIIAWQGPGKPVWMTGPAEYAFEGTAIL